MTDTQHLNRADLEDDVREYTRALSARLRYTSRDATRLVVLTGKMPLREAMELRGCIDDLTALRHRVREIERRIVAAPDGSLIA